MRMVQSILFSEIILARIFAGDRPAKPGVFWPKALLLIALLNLAFLSSLMGLVDGLLSGTGETFLVSGLGILMPSKSNESQLSCACFITGEFSFGFESLLDNVA